MAEGKTFGLIVNNMAFPYNVVLADGFTKAAEAAGKSIAPYLTTLNRIRSEHPALRQLRNLTVHASDDESILVYSKVLPGRFVRSGRTDGIIVVANVDPHSVRETTVHLDLEALGAAFGAEGTGAVMADMTNYTNIQPALQTSPS